MYLLYLDETIDNSNQIEGIGAVLITDKKCRKFYQEINKIAKNNGFEDVEIHADYIWNGRNEFSSLSMDQRANYSLVIANFLSSSGIARFIYTQSTLDGKNKDEIYIFSLEKVIEVAIKYVQQSGGKTSKQIMLIFDRREDINVDIYEELQNQHQRIIDKYKKSFFFLDCGYEGISKNSRLLQAADFIAYWSRQTQVIQDQPSLFKDADHEKKVALVKGIEKLFKKKLIHLK